MAATGSRLTAVVVAVVVIAGITAAIWPTSSPSGDAASPAAPLPHGREATGRAAAYNPPPPDRSTALAAAARSPAPSPSARRSCPAAASACVDLSDRLTWLQSGGRITYGPVPMEPGPPGTRNATPRGTFHVQWKAGPGYISTEYYEPMPYAVFFAPGGVAFHGGSLTAPSHGCVHLSTRSARYYHDHLPAGAEVAALAAMSDRDSDPANPAVPSPARV